MGGLGPGIGGLEYVVIGLVALLVLGPERLPVMLRKLGQMVAKARNMANEFRASFDEMARQAELDELRKEVEALKRGQGLTAPGAVPLGAEAEAAFRDIGQSLGQTTLASTTAPYAPPALPEPTVEEWPDAPPPAPEAASKPKRKAPAKKAAAKAAAKPAAKAEDKAEKSPAARKPSPARKAAAPRRTKKADQ